MSVSLPGSRTEVLRLAWPIAISMMSFTLKGTVDTWMVGRLGLMALAGVGFGGVLAWNFITLPWGVLRGQRPLVSQYVGAGQSAAAFSFGAHAFYLAGAVGLLLLLSAGAIGDLGASLAAYAGLDETTSAFCGLYLRGRMQFALPTLLLFAVAEYQRSLGRTRVPMAVDLLVHPLNVLFNAMFIFGWLGMPELGVYGAALGTGLADICGLVIILLLTRADRKVPGSALRLRWDRMKEVLKVGASGGVQFSLETMAFASITFVIAGLGTVAMAVHQVSMNVMFLSLLPAVAIGDAGAVLIGRFVGEKRFDEAARTLRSVLQIIMPFMGAMGLLFLLWGDDVVGLFLEAKDPQRRAEGVELAARVMIAVAVFQLADSLQIAFRFAMRAAGDHVWVTVVGVLCAWVLSVPLAAAVVYGFDGDLADVWLVWSIESWIGGLIFAWRWRSGRWRSHRLVKDEAPV
ncbi:MAG: MATE family efflux transporter [Planctomycetota bacterium]|nr:MATE family efflux transporter [Planctomycetota bacterium]